MTRPKTFGHTLSLVYGTTKDFCPYPLASLWHDQRLLAVPSRWSMARPKTFGRTLSLFYLHLTRINVVVVGGLEAAIN